jgi:hypothetical protein
MIKKMLKKVAKLLFDFSPYSYGERISGDDVQLKIKQKKNPCRQ